MAGNKRKEQVLIGRNLERFLDGKVRQGFKRSSYIRSLIQEAMRKEAADTRLGDRKRHTTE